MKGVFISLQQKPDQQTADSEHDWDRIMWFESDREMCIRANLP